MFNDQNTKLLNKYNWKVDYLDPLSNFLIINDNGCQIKNSTKALIALIEELVEEEIDELNNNLKLSDEDLLAIFGYEIVCESPLEIKKEDEFISGQAAKIMISYLRNKKHQNDISNYFKNRDK